MRRREITSPTRLGSGNANTRSNAHEAANALHHSASGVKNFVQNRGKRAECKDANAPTVKGPHTKRGDLQSITIPRTSI